MLILAIDTATRAAGVALLKNGQPYGEIILNTGLTHSVNLFPAVDRLLSLCNVSLDNITALAFSNGPGSFTGLRIGVSYITGLAQAKGIPIYPVPTLDALALNAANSAEYIAPILDARKNEVYTATYQVQADKKLKKVSSEKALSPLEFCKQFTDCKKVTVLGDAVSTYLGLLEEHDFTIPPSIGNVPRPSNIAYLAYQSFLDGDPGKNYNEIKISYLRASEAEIKLLSQR